MRKLDPRGALSPEDYLHLYWFDRCSEDMERGYADFLPTESMINRYNAFMEQWERRFAEDPARYHKSVDWDLDRKKTPYFLQKLQSGHEFEVWVEEEFRRNGVELGFYTDEQGQYAGENQFGLEIKHDMRLAETGNLYIEYQERLTRSGPWVDSGVLKEDNARYWLIGSPAEYYIFRKSDLVALYRELRDSPTGVRGCSFAQERTNGTSKGFLVSRQRAREIALARSIDAFVGASEHGYYAYGYYFHQDRQCKYIASKRDAELRVFPTAEAAQAAGYKRCTNPQCFPSKQPGGQGAPPDP